MGVPAGAAGSNPVVVGAAGAGAVFGRPIEAVMFEVAERRLGGNAAGTTRLTLPAATQSCSFAWAVALRSGLPDGALGRVVQPAQALPPQLNECMFE
jgi:hypothetical protein